MGRPELKALAAVLVAAAALAGGAAADGGQGPGRLTFEALQAGARFTGEFARFTTDITFDPAQPDACRFDVGIDIASADTQESRRDDLLKGPDFFWVERHPSARYRGTGCRRTTRGYALDGQLTLRGVTRPVALLFSFEQGARASHMTGSASLKRLDFGIGQGEWQSTEWVGDEVVVRFDLTLPRH